MAFALDYSYYYQSKNNNNNNKTTEDGKISPSVMHPSSSHYYHYFTNLNDGSSFYDGYYYISHLPQTIISGSNNNQTEQRLLLHSSNNNSNNTAKGFDFAKIAIQPKLKISQRGDEYEQEADRVAEQVMRLPADNSTVNNSSTLPVRGDNNTTKCSACDEMKNEKEGKKQQLLSISRKPSSSTTLLLSSGLEVSDGNEVTNEIYSTLRSYSSGGGSPLDPNTREFMESRFGYDFGKVKIHTDERAARSAKSVNALAYTVGNDIVFDEGQYQPDTIRGRMLLAHELVHVVQQNIGSMDFSQNAGQSSSRRNAFGDTEPGRAVHQQQLLAPENRQGIIIKSVVDPGTTTTQQHLQRFESPEHVQLGDMSGGASSGLIILECHNTDLPQHASPVATWPPEWQSYYSTLNADQKRALTAGLTYGEIVALTGDMYKDFQALNRAPLREVIDLIPRIRSMATTTEQFQEATGGRYLALAKDNIGHFSNVPTGQRNRDIWRRYHIDAIAAARMGNANLAWGLNAAGDHFLTDSFSAGHLRVERAKLHAQGVSGDIESKVLHDLDNKFGVEVTNDRGDPLWIAYGDEHLNDSADARNLSLASEAVRLSKQDISDALAQKTSYPVPTSTTVFAAERLIPRPVSMIANRWTTLDRIKELGHLAVSEAPGIASDLTGDDNRVRDWIQRTDTSSLGRQSEADITRMLNVLLSGVVTEADMRAIERLLGSVTDATVMSHLRSNFLPRAIELDFGMRERFRIALNRIP